ncbi:fasciclin domain-containing protein [Odoribacter laneus]|uniref:FAS1 domain-containing protein n=1 Tax=Odoribacter laneus YIT 12061 TaxID=742817 RepID=H1DHM9_9BACT|nr:fasciclin domain-containing protein [Odoribacter laneus]EHP47158.1 hypothetical protein HMPREF9449_01765 [Odoribacter laneus YIT 12061]
MKTYSIILALSITLFLFVSCEDNFHDTGKANGVFNGTIWEYLNSDPKNYSDLVILIQHAGLEPLLDGKVSDNPELTFFAPTNFSIYQFLFKTVDNENNRIYQSVSDIPVEMAREMILSYIIPGRRMRESFNYEIKGTNEGGSLCTTLTNLELRVYRIHGDFYDVPDIGADILAIHFIQTGFKSSIASSDHQTDNGIVHSLDYDFLLVNPVVHLNE